MLTLLLAFAGSGCDGDPPGGRDGGDVDASVDSGNGDGLVFDLRASPELPAELGGDHAIELETVRLVLEDVRAIGDAATGDDRTSRSTFDLAWGEEADNRLIYPDAPPGIYARLLATVASYEMRGWVTLETGRVAFVVSDAAADLDLAIELGQPMLLPGSSLEIEVEVAVGEPLFEVGWSELAGADSILIDETSSVIGAVREHLAEAFRVED